ncbi:hypothetical protein XENTR_v10017322 [Xenopus tropicalis]|nr:hypothetical protein XENTR_v10017322 [Xenopus tropicalis]
MSRTSQFSMQRIETLFFKNNSRNRRKEPSASHRRTIMALWWFITLGLFLIFPTMSAADISNITLYRNLTELKVNSWNMIPCTFSSNSTINPEQLYLEWVKTIDGGKSFIPLVGLFGTNQGGSTKSRNRFKVFPSLLPRGNCSLVINPAKSMDWGTYSVRLSTDGIVYEPVPEITVQIMDKKRNLGETLKEKR